MLENSFHKKESPLVGMLGGGPGGTLGISGGTTADPVYVDDVFSTFLYDGTGSAQTINNGIDLSGEGGLVWAKVRNTTIDHHLVDTVRGGSKYLRSSSNAGEGTDATMITSFNSDGFTIGSSVYFSQSPRPYCTWTFRKQPGFFDIVTYTGNGVAGREISHSLGGTPGMIMVKRTDDADNWTIQHRSLGGTKSLYLNRTDGQDTSSTEWNNTSFSSTVFTVGTSGKTNEDGNTYVAYIFGHDDQSFGTSADQAIIKCGSYTGNGSTPGSTIDLGFEPQFLLIKNTNYTDATSNWMMFDMMRGLAAQPEMGTQALTSNLTTAEGGSYVGGGNTWVHPTSTGFMPGTSANAVNRNGDTFIYMAIRRPHKPPTAATEVLDIQTSSNDASGTFSSTTVTADFTLSAFRNLGSVDKWIATRLLNNTNSGTKLLRPNANNSADSYSQYTLDHQFGFKHTNFYQANNIVEYTFRRAAGFMDVVTYKGNGSARTIAHNLGATPSVVLVKSRDATYQWYWQHYVLGKDTFLQLNNDEIQGGNGNLFNDTLPTSSVFSIGDLGGGNNSGDYYVAYLFADLDGISKAGTYSGTGSNINVDCGFSAGARFIIIKRANAAGDWYLYDSVRGIVSGNDPYVIINNQNTEVTNTDYIDPLSSGFTVTSSAPAGLNTSGGTYLFLAIA